MSAPSLSARQCDQALAALALMVAKERGNTTDVAAITTSTDPADLIHGLMLIAGAARHGHAAAAGVPITTIDELLRSMYLGASA